MTVRDLRALISALPDDAPIEVYDAAWGTLDYVNPPDLLVINGRLVFGLSDPDEYCEACERTDADLLRGLSEAAERAARDASVQRTDLPLRERVGRRSFTVDVIPDEKA